MLGFLWLARERTQSYTIHERPHPLADRLDRAEALEFVKDGFSFGAFLLPEVWLIAHGIWLGLLAFVAAAAAILALGWAFGVPPFAVAGLLALLHLVFGNEADEIKRAHLANNGWTMIGQVTGTGALDCERRFFDSWLPSVPMIAGAGAAGIAASAAEAGAAPVSWRWRGRAGRA